MVIAEMKARIKFVGTICLVLLCLNCGNEELPETGPSDQASASEEPEPGLPEAEVDFQATASGGSTPPVPGPNSIATLESGDLGGVRQWISIRGAAVSNPVLLWLHGGPGFTEMPFISSQRRLEQTFVVVNWDQRGAGKSYDRQMVCESLTTEALVQDAHDLVVYLLRRFDKEKLYLLGHSWGSVIGMLVVAAYPDLFHAFFAVGLPVNTEVEEELSLTFVKDTAKHEGNLAALGELKAISFPYANRAELAIQRKWLARFGGMLWRRELLGQIFDPQRYANSPEYLPEDWKKRATGIGFSLGCMRTEISSFDLYSLVAEIKAPVYFFLGIHDHQVPFEASVAYFDFLRAPFKEIVWFHNSAHYPHLEETDRFAQKIAEILRDG